jgi:hypothetical protein
MHSEAINEANKVRARIAGRKALRTVKVLAAEDPAEVLNVLLDALSPLDAPEILSTLADRRAKRDRDVMAAALADARKLEV